MVARRGKIFRFRPTPGEFVTFACRAAGRRPYTLYRNASSPLVGADIIRPLPFAPIALASQKFHLLFSTFSYITYVTTFEKEVHYAHS